MQVVDQSVVTFHYSLHNAAGELLESSRDAEPSVYLHGANNIIQGLEAAMAQHSVGDNFEVELPPERAYGLRNEQMQQKVPVKHLIYRGKLRSGMVVQLSTDRGQRSVTVLKVGRHSATIDGNHPLAGQQLKFTIEILGVRPASAEEAAHGHAHGPGGHHH